MKIILEKIDIVDLIHIDTIYFRNSISYRFYYKGLYMLIYENYFTNFFEFHEKHITEDFDCNSLPIYSSVITDINVINYIKTFDENKNIDYDNNIYFYINESCIKFKAIYISIKIKNKIKKLL